MLSVCTMVVPLPALAPLTPVCTTVQLNVVPATLLVSEIPVVPPEQKDWELGVAVATGRGVTVMVTRIGVPVQPPAVGVTVYVTVPADAPVADNVWAIEAPLPADPPLAPVIVGAVQAKVVPATLLLRAILVALPEQIVWLAGVAVATGRGLTVIVTVIGVPLQPPATGVIV